ncbi:MAG: signal transduction histidine kinase with CheB and CheR [Bacilli bacterium]|nr:signal transduction histidine kinase with CheB and CheR [Bacilli bacterium]
MQLGNESDLTKDRIKEFSVVGIAVSSLKLGALKQFLDHLDIVHGMSYVIVQLGTTKSKAIQIEQLSKHTNKKIFHAENQMEILSDCIYLLPPQHDIAFRAGKIHLTEYSSDSKSPNMPADRFMKALVKGFGSNTIGILFSGNGIDGTRGIEAIAQVNGLIMVEEKNTDKPVRLTGSDIEIDRTDYILSPQDMPQHIIEYIEFYMNQTKESIEVELKTLFSIIKQASGTDFSVYKQASVMRRIQRRMGLQQFQYLKEYNKYLYHHANEVTALQKDLLIGVTEFFRDPIAFSILADKIIPSIFERQRLEKKIRVWVPGCSTGEEVYSIAILMRKYMEETEETFEVKIFATDLDKDAIKTASKGVYSENITNNVQPELLKAYFTLDGNHYKVNKEIRQMVIFAQHNLLIDPPFIQMDLVSCRNLLIYLQPEAQRKVISIFDFSLKSEACLFLGPSETLGKLTNLFIPLNNKWNIYQHKENKHLYTESSLVLGNGENEKKLLHKNKIITRLKETEKILKLDTIYTKLIEEYVAACIIVDENNDIIHINGDANQYLSIPKGKPSLNLFKMIPEYLSIIIGTALHKARKEKKDVLYRDVAIKDNHKRHSIHLTVKSFTVHSTNEKLMILFFEEAEKQGESGGEDINEENKIQMSFNLKGNISQHIEVLDQELLLAKDSLQALNQRLETSNEELETSIEELETANDQLIVSNEELQSTNEELQSGNEELVAVNNEYQFKIQELTDLNTDMSNFFNSTNIATVFLDGKLNIRKFTPAATKEINLEEKQIGLSIGDLSHNLKYEHLATDARKVLLTGKPIENEAQNLKGEWFAIKILPYLSIDNLKEGVVITCVNITEQRRTSLSEETAKQNGVLELMHISEMLAVAGQLAAGITQEIRNPLLSLKEFTKSSESMTSELDRIEAMINELLILAPPLKTRFANIDVVDILQDVIALFEPQALLKKVEILVKFSVPVLFINCVQVQLKQLFINILSNGIDAMPQGGNMIVKVKVAAGKTAVISFSDSGAEIPKRKPPKLDESAKPTKENGEGLDMLVNYKIIESHQGAISFESTPGKGTVVEIVLKI